MNTMQKTLASVALMCFAALTPAMSGSLKKEGRSSEVLRTPIVSFTNRDIAAAGKANASECFAALTWSKMADRLYRCDINLSLIQMDRDIYVTLQGASTPFTLRSNGELVGTTYNSSGVSEFLLDPFVVQGHNILTIELLEPDNKLNFKAFKEVPPRTTYLMWQPMAHLEDYALVAGLDSATNSKGQFSIALSMCNSFNGNSGPMQVWYEIEDDKGNLVDYSYREIEMQPLSRDTVHLTRTIRTVSPWTAQNPRLYKVIFKIRQNGNFTEYVSQMFGFRNTSVSKRGVPTINGKEIKIKGVRLESDFAALDHKEQTKILEQFKKLGINAISLGAPMNTDFYKLTDRLGFYVNQGADINYINYSLDAATLRPSEIQQYTTNGPTNLLANQAATIGALDKLYRQHKSITSITHWDMGTAMDNGYNMQLGYIHLKGLDTVRPVWYTAAHNEWNTDLQGRYILPATTAIGPIIEQARADNAIITDLSNGSPAINYNELELQPFLFISQATAQRLWDPKATPAKKTKRRK